MFSRVPLAKEEILKYNKDAENILVIKRRSLFNVFLLFLSISFHSMVIL